MVERGTLQQRATGLSCLHNAPPTQSDFTGKRLTCPHSSSPMPMKMHHSHWSIVRAVQEKGFPPNCTMIIWEDINKHVYDKQRGSRLAGFSHGCLTLAFRLSLRENRCLVRDPTTTAVPQRIMWSRWIFYWFSHQIHRFLFLDALILWFLSGIIVPLWFSRCSSKVTNQKKVLIISADRIVMSLQRTSSMHELRQTSWKLSLEQLLGWL